MSRITAEFETAQSERQAAIAKIGAGMRQEKHKNKASLAHAMDVHRAATKGSLHDIFGTAAFTRGAADEMIERFKNEREACASDLRNQLGAYVADLQETVGKELAHLTSTRAKTARREENVRRAQLKDLRRRVQALLTGAAKLIEEFNKDRQRAERVWDQHLRKAPRQRQAAIRVAAKGTVAPHKRSARRKAKK
jgi:hypothetical protein